MVFTAVVSLVAGLLTVLAPCVLPLLPIILGGSLDARTDDRRRPFVIAASLVLSLIAFTLLLKASTVLIGVDPSVWTYVSGGLILVLGISMLFPSLWTRVSERIGLERGSNVLLSRAFAHKGRTLSAVLIGASLGPVFSSCSPTYAWAIATVLPSSPALGMAYLSLYCLGVGAALLAIALLGRRLLDRIRWAADPRGWFNRIVAVLFLLVGLSLVTGMDKVIQTKLLTLDPFGITRFEGRLVPSAQGSTTPTQMSPEDMGAYQAPDFVGIADWLNSTPLTMSGLRGKVVLIDFWTYSCINCQRTQPYLNAWYDTYASAGLVIVGVHAPEFAFEQVPSNVQKAITEEGIKYPVALDNNFKTWAAYNNQYWPAKYLIDKDGRVRYTHFGEGSYAETESKIRELLGEPSSAASVQVSAGPAVSALQTPETYLGTARAERFTGTPLLGPSGTYSAATALQPNQWTLGGSWEVTPETLTASQDGATITLRFTGKNVYLVMGGPAGARVKVSVDGQDVPGADVTGGTVTIGDYRLYELVSADHTLNGDTLRLTFPQGVSVNSFTFG